MRPLLLGTVLLALLAPSLALAQIINVQSRFKEDPDPGLNGAVQFSVDWRTGANDYLALRGGLTAYYRTDPHLVLALVQGEYGLSQGVPTLGRTMEHLRYRFRLLEWLSAEAFGQHEYNEFRRLQLRVLVGVGPRFKVASTEELGLVLGVAGMFDHEESTRGDEADSGQINNDVRISSYLLARLGLMKNLSVVETIYFQPRVDKPSDLRVLNDTSLVVKANQYVAISLSLVLTYDTAPPDRVPALDTQLQSSLGVSF